MTTAYSDAPIEYVPAAPAQQYSRLTAKESAMRRPRGFWPTLVLLVGAAYCFFPVAWILISATKSTHQLFSLPALLPASSLVANVRDLFAFRNGIFIQWALNTGLYALVGGVLVTLISAAAGYALAKYRFPGSGIIFRVLVAGVLVPQIVLAIPLFLLFARVGLANTYWSVLLPALISPFAIFLCRIYAEASVPDEVIEAARIDGASELRIFWSVGLRLMVPCLITVFLLQFIAIWNNYLLPLVMLSDETKFPLTVGLTTMLATGTAEAPLYNLVITGAVLSVIPVVALFLALQRFWRIDLVSGAVKA